MSRELEGSSSSCIDQFIHSVRTCFSVVPKSYTKKSLWDVQIVLTRKQERKKNQYVDHGNKHTFKDCSPQWRGHYTVHWGQFEKSNRPSDLPIVSQMYHLNSFVPLRFHCTWRKAGEGTFKGTKINAKQYFQEKTSSSAFERGVPKPCWAEPVGCTVNACMHVDTGTDLDLVSHFVGPQSQDKSILGTVSSLKQGSQQNFLKKKGPSIHQ